MTFMSMAIKVLKYRLCASREALLGVMGHRSIHTQKERWSMTEGRNGVTGLALSFLTGCVVGGIAGLLAAPQSGVRTRRQISNYAADVRERAGEATEDTTAAIQKVITKGRNLAEEATEDTTAAIQKVVTKGRNLVEEATEDTTTAIKKVIDKGRNLVGT